MAASARSPQEHSLRPLWPVKSGRALTLGASLVALLMGPAWDQRDWQGSTARCHNALSPGLLLPPPTPNPQPLPLPISLVLVSAAPAWGRSEQGSRGASSWALWPPGHGSWLVPLELIAGTEGFWLHARKKLHVPLKRLQSTVRGAFPKVLPAWLECRQLSTPLEALGPALVLLSKDVRRGA